MGTSAPDLVGSPSNNQLIMKQFVVLLAFLSPLALAEAEASYGIHGGALGYAGSVGIAAAPVAVAQRAITAPHCQTTYDTVTEPVCHWWLRCRSRWCWCCRLRCRCWCCRLRSWHCWPLLNILQMCCFYCSQ